MSFTIENEKENKMSFLDISGTSVCCKPTSCRLYTHLESILSSTYKIGMIHRFLYRCFWIYLDWDKFRFELVKVNGCLQEQRLSWELYFFFWCFLITNKGIQEKLITGPKKPLFSVLPYLGSLPLQTRTKLRKSLKGILHRCKLQIVCKSLSKLSNAFVWEIERSHSKKTYIWCRLYVSVRTLQWIYYGEYVRPWCKNWGAYCNLITDYKEKLSLRVVLLSITCYFVTQSCH